MASLIISSAAVTAVSRANPSQTRKVVVVPMNGIIKLSNSSVTQTNASSLATPFTGLKSNCTFPMSKKFNYIDTSLTSNGGRARCAAAATATAAATNWINGNILKAENLTFEDPTPWIAIGTDGAKRFTGGKNITNYGEIDVATQLQKGKEYEIIYYVYMKTQQKESFLNFSIDLPDGTSIMKSSKFTVNVGSRETPISIGKFTCNDGAGTVAFKFSSVKPEDWTDLVIHEVSLV